MQKYYNFKIKDLLIYISLFLLCLTSGSVLEVINRMGMFALYICSLVFLYISFYQNSIFTKIELNRFLFFFLFIFLYYGLFANFIRKDLTVFMFLLRFFFTYTFVTFVGYEKFRVYFYRIIRIICIHAILVFFFQFLFSPTKLPWCTWGPAIRSYYGILNYGAKECLLGIEFYRNQGLFTEPGILSVYASVGLLMAFKETNYKNKLLFIITLLSTFSTTALIVLFVFIVFKICDKKKFHYFFVFIPFSLFFIIYSFSQKMDLSKTYSGIQRIADMYFCVKVFMKNWILGVGFSEDNYIRAFKSIDVPEFMSTFAEILYDRGSSNGAAVIFSKGGVIFGLLYFILLTKQKIIQAGKIKVLIILVLCLCGEPFAFTSLFLVFIASAITKSETRGIK